MKNSNKNILNIYNFESRQIEKGLITEIPNYCKNHFNEKCKTYYDKLDIKKADFYICPYGFSTFVYKENVYSSILIKGCTNKKTKRNIEINNESFTDFVLYDKETVIKILDYSFKKDDEINIHNKFTHDIGNISKYFNYMTANIDQESLEEDLMPLLSLYELINFRVRLYETEQQGNYKSAGYSKEIRGELRPQLKKLKSIMSYAAKDKNINIRLQFEQENIVSFYPDVFLAFFIILENAIKYGLKDNTIFINFIENSENHTTVEFINIGPKVFEYEIPLLKQRGFRGETAKELGKSGSGLGLSMAEEIFSRSNCKTSILIEETTYNNSNIPIECSKFKYQVTFKNK